MSERANQPTGRQELFDLADGLTDRQVHAVAEAGRAALQSERRIRGDWVGVIPGTATRIEYRKDGGTVINHGLPPGGHSGVVNRFLRLNPHKTVIEETPQPSLDESTGSQTEFTSTGEVQEIAVVEPTGPELDS
jgi:hypothetical protein